MGQMMVRDNPANYDNISCQQRQKRGWVIKSTLSG